MYVNFHFILFFLYIYCTYIKLQNYKLQINHLRINMLIKKWEMLPYMYSTVFTPLEGKSLWLALPCLPCVEIFINDLTKSNLPNKLLTFHKINATTFSFLHWPTLKSTILIENWQWIYPLAYTEKLTIGSLYGQLTIDAITVRKIADLCVHCTDNCNWCVHFMHNWRLVHSLYGQLTIGAFTVRTIDDWCVHCSDNWRLMRSPYGQLTIDAFSVRTIDDWCVHCTDNWRFMRWRTKHFTIVH